MQGMLAQEQARTQRLKQTLTSLEAEYHATLDRMQPDSQPSSPKSWGRTRGRQMSY